MSDRIRKATGLCLLVLMSAVLFGQAATTPKYILQTKFGTNVTPLSARYGFRVTRTWQAVDHQSYQIAPAAPFTPAVIAALDHETGVIGVEADSEVSTGDESSAYLSRPARIETLTQQLHSLAPVNYFGATVRATYVSQPATQLIGLAAAQATYPSGAGVVAIIDTGVDPHHPALQRALLPGFDFTRNVPGASEFADLSQSTVAILDQSTVAILDCKNIPIRLNQSTVAILDQSTVAILDTPLPAAFGHGTMTAGLVHLVAPSARILPLKAFNADGSSLLSNIVQAIYYAVNNGATVISMSFSIETDSPELSTAIAYAVKQGVLLVASAGNDGKEKRVYPAGYPQVFGIGSTNYSDHRSPFSNYGDGVKAAAPGEAVITTFPGNNYAGVWGTSFSAPMIAGTLAILHQINPKLTASQAHDALDRGVKVLGDVGSRLSLPLLLKTPPHE